MIHLWVLTLFVFFLVACTKEREVVGPCLDCPFLIIEGRVAQPDGGIPARVVGVRVDPPNLEFERISATADSSGAYRLLLPPGAYRLFADMPYPTVEGRSLAWTSHGLSFDLQAADTLHLQTGDAVRRIDFELGAASATVTIPEEFLDTGLWFLLTEITSGTTLDRTHDLTQTQERVDLGFAPPGEYHLAVGRYGGLYTLTQPGSDEPELIRVQAGARTEIPFALPRPAHIRGRVLGSWEELGGYPTPEVALVSEDSSQTDIRLSLWDTTSFDLAVFHAMTARVKITMGGHARWLGGADFATATRYAITPGQDIDLPDFVESGLRVSLVFDDPDALDRDHVRVKLTDKNKVLLSEYSRSLEPNSPLGISNLAVGTYYLHIQPDWYGETPWIPEWYDGSRYLATATPIEVTTEGSITDVVFSPQKGGWINFRLRYRGRLLPYADAYVVEETEPNRRVGMPLFSADGAFAFRGLRSGRWKLGIVTYPRSERPQLLWYPGTRDSRDALPIEVTAGTPTDTLEWNLPE